MLVRVSWMTEPPRSSNRILTAQWVSMETFLVSLEVFFKFKNRIMCEVFSGCGEGRTDLRVVTACPHQPGAPPSGSRMEPQRGIPSRWTSRGHSTHFETLCPSAGGSGSLFKQSRATVTTNLPRKESGPSAQTNSKLKPLPDAENSFY